MTDENNSSMNIKNLTALIIAITGLIGAVVTVYNLFYAQADPQIDQTNGHASGTEEKIVNNKIYLFNGDEFILFDPVLMKSEVGYPMKRKNTFPGLWDGKIDAAVTGPDDKMYFFTDSIYTRFSTDIKQPDGTYPRDLFKFWGDTLWSCCVDAVMSYPTNKKFYIFKGDEYIRLIIDTEKLDNTVPSIVGDNWDGVWVDGIDAAVRIDSTIFMMFKGNEYLRYDITHERVIEGPKTIDGNLKGVWVEGVDAAVRMEF